MSFEVSFLDEPVSLRAGVGPWIDRVKKKVASRILAHLAEDTGHLERYLECAGLAELPGALLGCAFFQRDLNDAFTRLGLFMGAGKGVPKGTLLAHDDPTLANYKKLVAGHNLPGDVILNFFRAAEAAPDARLRPNEAERAMKNGLLQSGRSTGAERFYVIGFSVQSTKDPVSVFSHEVYHAYYYLLPEYRDEVRTFWREVVTSDDRRAIQTEIARAYNVTDEDLVIDECQAYLLQTLAERDHLKAFVPKYRAELRERIVSRVSTPLPS